ncbi:amidohydrolase family protein, partial [bacterium]|nr:amidohydrolase family protein [bacterium]
FANIEALQMPIFWHVADPEEFWEKDKIPPIAKERGWDYTDGTYPGKEELYRRVANILERFPKLKIVFAHFYFLSADLERAEKLLESFPNVNLDITPGSEMYYNFSAYPDKTREFFIKYQDRIVFGDDTAVTKNGIAKELITNRIRFMRDFLETDKEFSVGPTDKNFLARPDTVKGIKLPEPVLKKIYRLNFLRIVGDKPIELNIPLAKEECHRIG